MSSADPSKLMATTDSSSSTMNSELYWGGGGGGGGGGVPKIIMKTGTRGLQNFMIPEPAL